MGIHKYIIIVVIFLGACSTSNQPIISDNLVLDDENTTLSGVTTNLPEEALLNDVLKPNNNELEPNNNELEQEQTTGLLIEDLEDTDTTKNYKSNAKADLIKINRIDLTYKDYDQYVRIIESNNANQPQDKYEINDSFINKIFTTDPNADLKAINKNNKFAEDNLFIYNQVPIILLSIPSKETILSNTKQNPAIKYIANSKPYSNNVQSPQLLEIHTILLNELIQKTPANEKVVVFIYSYPNATIKWMGKDKYKETRSLYIQLISGYLYNNLNNLRLEYRYTEEMPQDELLITVFGYDGTLPLNVYSISKTKGVDWLKVSLEITQKLREQQRLAKEAVQKALSNIGK